MIEICNLFNVSMNIFKNSVNKVTVKKLYKIINKAIIMTKKQLLQRVKNEYEGKIALAKSNVVSLSESVGLEKEADTLKTIIGWIEQLD